MRRALLALVVLLALAAPGDARRPTALRGRGGPRLGNINVAQILGVSSSTLALDTTAHPGGTANNITTNQSSGAWQNMVSPAFSTGAGPLIVVMGVFADGTGAPYTAGGAASCTNCNTATVTKRVDQTVTTTGVQIWTFFSASAALTNATVTFTANANLSTQKAIINVWVIKGTPSTEAGTIGNTGGAKDPNLATTGSSGTINATVTPAAGGSWLLGVFSEANDSTAITADSNTSAWDLHFNTFTGGDVAAFGRYKVSGTVATTSAGTPVTFGSSTADSFWSTAALEIKTGP